MSREQNFVTILMPVYNGVEYLQQTIDSLLTQTHSNFELLIIDDGSTDGSDSLVKGYFDPRIRFVKNECNMGLIYTLNKGINLSKGRYIARMDADDIAAPNRLSRQLDFMFGNPGVGICGTWSRTFGKVQKSWETTYPVAHEEIVAHMIFNTALSHPTVMIDRERFPSDFEFYSANMPHAEDYDLWVRAADVTRLGNVPEVLLDYRLHDAQVSSKYAKIQKESADKVRNNLLKRFGIFAAENDLFLHSKIARYEWAPDSKSCKPAFVWLRRIANEAKVADKNLLRAIRSTTLSKAVEISAQLKKPSDRIKTKWMKFSWPGMR